MIRLVVSVSTKSVRSTKEGEVAGNIVTHPPIKILELTFSTSCATKVARMLHRVDAPFHYLLQQRTSVLKLKCIFCQSKSKSRLLNRFGRSSLLIVVMQIHKIKKKK